MFVVNFVLGLMIVIAGVVAVKMNFRIVQLFSRDNVFERKLGPGSTYLVFQLVAILAILFGGLMMFSLHDNILEFLLRPFTQAFGL